MGKIAVMPLAIRFPVAAYRPTMIRMMYFCHFGRFRGSMSVSDPRLDGFEGLELPLGSLLGVGISTMPSSSYNLIVPTTGLAAFL